MSFFNKLKWFLGILVIFIIVVATNLIDSKNFSRVNDAVVSIYEDRLVAKGLIFDMLQGIHTKELAAATNDVAFFEKSSKNLSEKIKDFIVKFEKTKLTAEEINSLRKLKDNLDQLIVDEAFFINSNYTEKERYLKSIENVKINLNDLSSIQMKEGRRQMIMSQKAIDMIDLFTHLEIYFLIFLAIAIQVIVMYNPKKRKERDEE